MAPGCRTWLVAICVVAGLSDAICAEREILPFELSRSLQMLQENVAHGSPTAQEVQQKLLSQMELRFLRAKPEVWKDDKNVAAVLLHALSGGNPKVLKTLIEQNSIGEASLPLAKGTLAYAEGRSEAAARYLEAIDARQLALSLGGYVALAQAVLIADSDPKKAIELLDLARLLMPGTLVEEAALRREILVAVKDGDIEKFERLSRQQLTRFSRSLYAIAFRHQFADSIVRLDYGEGAGRLKVLESMLDPLEPGDRKDLYLLIARNAVVGGRIAIARFASDKAMELSPAAGEEVKRAELYAAAAQIVTEDFDAGLKRLKVIDGKLLSKEDAELLESAINLAALVREWPKREPEIGPPKPPSRHSDESTIREDKSFSAILERANKAILRADEELKGSSP